MQDNILNPDEKLRLQVFIAKCGIASRRAAEKIITEGRVCVNDSIVTEMGTKVGSDDIVTVDGVVAKIEQEKRYVLLNKPIGYVCSMSDENGRPVAVDLIKDKYKERLYNVGRLDMFSSGLIIFTNDGQFAAKLSHPSAEVEKEYLVQTSLPLPVTFSKDFEKGLRVDNIFYRCTHAEEINSHKIKITLIEGKNREIRNVFAFYDIGIKSLTRIRIGPIKIENLAVGQSRNLSKQEIKELLVLCKN